MGVFLCLGIPLRFVNVAAVGQSNGNVYEVGQNFVKGMVLPKSQPAARIKKRLPVNVAAVRK